MFSPAGSESEANLVISGDQATIKRNAGDDSSAAGAGTNNSRQLLHERQEEVHGQVEGGGGGHGRLRAGPGRPERQHQVRGLRLRGGRPGGGRLPRVPGDSRRAD